LCGIDESVLNPSDKANKKRFTNRKKGEMKTTRKNILKAPA
jgi:hypothetical protein